ncbi:MAG: antibiotic biosynthesis monooxygenase [Alphaproteobacteria bacterium]|jgi:heme-degrading monooxygenase HmoA|nr:antibiotic biosynthesis monooxygenase [Alphaproteobacteria bacterium]MDP6590442.1 antibiotic biosynthesis monooxygenase [Alphaproteobacteria bacterium]|tara:strand:+ start:242 stop:559 length:318 start_codon:yes stop_codon:yes gene_type:complete
MIVVIFEVQPNQAGRQRYFDLAGELRPELEKQDGFISIERLESLAEAGKFVSISFWRDEDAVVAWRRHPGHAAAQDLGRRELFADYRITVAQSLRVYGPQGAAPE